MESALALRLCVCAFFLTHVISRAPPASSMPPCRYPIGWEYYANSKYSIGVILGQDEQAKSRCFNVIQWSLSTPWRHIANLLARDLGGCHLKRKRWIELMFSHALGLPGAPDLRLCSGAPFIKCSLLKAAKHKSWDGSDAIAARLCSEIAQGRVSTTTSRELFLLQGGNLQGAHKHP